MRYAGFVLAGGESRRMGRDKALLPFHGRTLLEHQARLVEQAAGSVQIIGSPERYACLGFPVTPDAVAGHGPAAGILTALRLGFAEWNLVAACDMPGLTLGSLQDLLKEANSTCDCVAPLGPDGEPEPLCALYHRRCLPHFERAIQEKRLKMRDLLAELDCLRVTPAGVSEFVNLNTPADWAQFEESR